MKKKKSKLGASSAATKSTVKNSLKLLKMPGVRISWSTMVVMNPKSIT